MAKRDGEGTIGNVMKSFIETHKLQDGLDKISVKDAWFSVLGEAIDRYTTDVHLDRDTLYVRLSSSVLREELSYGKDKIIKLLNEELGKDLVKKLILR